MKLLIIALFFPLSCSSQQLKPLAVGDALPNLQLTGIINYRSSSADLSELSKVSPNSPLGDRGGDSGGDSGKLLILDFWSTWCTSCLKKFPHLDSLQKQFGDHLQILLVNSKATGDDSLKVTAFFSKRKNTDGSSFQFPYITGDTALHDLFPHTFLPHYIWIYKNKFIAATNAAEITSSNIEALLSGRTVDLKIKNDSLRLSQMQNPKPK